MKIKSENEGKNNFIITTSRDELGFIARALDVYRNYCFDEEEVDQEYYKKERITANKIHKAIIEINHKHQIMEVSL